MNENLNYQRFQRSHLQEEFESKNEILRSRFTEISPDNYLSVIFSDKRKGSDSIIVLGTLKDDKGNIVEKGTIVRIKFKDIWGIAWRSNAYIPYCDFKNNYYHSKTVEVVRAFVVDCDNISSRNLLKILRYVLKQLPKPTYIVNSGKGIHLVYTLLKPQPVKGWRWSLNTLNKSIQNSYEKIGNLDRHPLVHPYRFPGFMTKINTTASVFKVHEHYTFEELMSVFKLNHRKPENRKRNPKSKAKILVLPNGRRAFFEWVLWKLFMNPPIPGRRQNSFFALGIVSYKCKREVPYQEAVEAVDMVYDDIERYHLQEGFTRTEAHKAFEKGYDPKYIRAGWKYLSGLLGWEYRPNKRNGKKRNEHLAFARQVKRLRIESRWKELERHISSLMSQGYEKQEIARIIGINRTTLWRRFSHLWK